MPYLLLTASLHAAPVFIGTNTSGSAGSKGIYLADFDATTGKLSEPNVAAEYKNPGFLAQHPSKPIIYACGQPTKPFPDDSGSVAAFEIGDTNLLKFLGEASSGGKDACHVALDATGKTLAVANYGDGTFATIKLKEDGGPGEIASLIADHGSGPDPKRQQGPHAHGVYFGPSNERLLVPDLGIDQVMGYPFDAASSKLGEPLAPLVTAPGAGPRHLAFSPEGGAHVYVINELDNTVLAATYRDGGLAQIGTNPTLPPDFAGGNTTAEIEVHPNGKFVYASNRGHDSITVYSRDPDSGALKFIQNAPCGGKNPRHFKIDPSGKWLLCAHQDSNTISVLSLDSESGKLGEPGSTVSAPSPICLLFAR